ncbi:hypothetical protein EPO04_01075 [Patescibacteria group bacterium]|nr:MAG: hypothetical protein EPO04_01075 [Patescibacteria group bacterium]
MGAEKVSFEGVLERLRDVEVKFENLRANTEGITKDILADTNNMPTYERRLKKLESAVAVLQRLKQRR